MEALQCPVTTNTPKCCLKRIRPGFSSLPFTFQHHLTQPLIVTNFVTHLEPSTGAALPGGGGGWSPQVKSVSASGHLAPEGWPLTTFSPSPSLASVRRLVPGAFQSAVHQPPSSVHWALRAGEQAEDVPSPPCRYSCLCHTFSPGGLGQDVGRAPRPRPCHRSHRSST